MTDQLQDRLTDNNLLDPLEFEEGEISLFLRDHACVTCVSSGDDGHLLSRPVESRKWQAFCPKCGPVLAHTHIHKARREAARQGMLAGKMELRTIQKSGG